MLDLTLVITRRSWGIFCFISLFTPGVLADCISEQLACTNNCMLTNSDGFNCINQCGTRAQSCIENEYESSGNSSNKHKRPISYYDDGDRPSTNYLSPSSQQRSTETSTSADTSTSDKFDRSEDYSHCYETFYDKNEYNWLAIRNNCSEAIDVTYICRTCGERIGSEATVKPGKSTNTGLSAKEVSAKGGLSFAICRDGYRAVGNTSGGTWRADTGYYCMKN